MAETSKKYPDISKILEAKRQHRRLLAQLPFEKKIELALKMKQRDDFIKSISPVRNGAAAETPDS